MSKKFEDYYSELQADMVSIYLEYVDNRADKIYIYYSCKGNTISSDFFYCINNKIGKKHKLNEAVSDNNENIAYDTSVDRQKAVLRIINDDIMKIYKLCKEYKREMPTEMKLIYDVKKNSLKAEYRYDLVYSRDPVKIADDIVTEWFEKVKLENEKN